MQTALRAARIRWQHHKCCCPVPRGGNHCYQQRSSHAAHSYSDRQSHNAHQTAVFSSEAIVTTFLETLPADVQQRLQEIVQTIPELSSESRVIDVGSGTGQLVPFLRQRGVQDILAVDLAPEMLEALKTCHGASSTVGNEPGLRTWQGDFIDLPSYLGTADAIFMNAVFGNFFSQRDALVKACFLLRPGGHLVISHPMGRAWHTQLRMQTTSVVAHELPDQASLEHMVQDLPLQLASFRDEPQLYAALLQVSPRYALKGGPLRLSGPVVTGFGRGSKQLGVPTANIDPASLLEQLRALPKGVYFGWAKLDAPVGSPPGDSAVHKMVMNIGSCPTVKDGDADVTVECHILHSYQSDFYGQQLRVMAVGYIRPEMRFDGLASLLTRIRADIGIAKTQLDDPMYVSLQASL